jgi:hypothetical protein
MTALRLLHIDDQADNREIVAVTLGLDAKFAALPVGGALSPSLHSTRRAARAGLLQRK